jgi:hypothetical protein
MNISKSHPIYEMSALCNQNIQHCIHKYILPQNERLLLIDWIGLEIRKRGRGSESV